VQGLACDVCHCLPKCPWVLLFVAEAVVVAGEGVEGPKLVPAGAQLLLNVSDEATNV
jgi:hypothetical protein